WGWGSRVAREGGQSVGERACQNSSASGLSLSNSASREMESRRLNESLFQNLAAAVWALRGLFQYVIRHARIRTGNAIEDVIERNFSSPLYAIANRSLSGYSL